MKFIYSGPASGVTLADGTEVLLWPGSEVELPEDLDYTQTLLALKYLTPVAVETVADPEPEQQPLKGKKEKETNSGS
ncbi:hypothetical protein [Salmonella enterica]|uniref:hypothetical protein n=1 Tax=Salmonella enterica TaxID=28901 RepID=UPI0021D4EE09|nr:hypothetical protein [Salmonella enterica]MCU7097918.1 hypothetical protein [Salmonella enterica]MCU7116323.1 hypothetical protein [Salmonella enterica]MCU7123692.1 hypothetical protein [Salmonella enterica]MCU7123711.1 hypothetical protein [Salmonella enterica]